MCFNSIDSVDDLIFKVDAALFKSILALGESHPLHHLLPACVRYTHDLRTREYDHELPLVRTNRSRRIFPNRVIFQKAGYGL